MTTRQIGIKFWPEASLPTTVRRLQRLRENAYINHADMPWLRERCFYTPSQAGNRALVDNGLLDPKLEGDYPRRPQAFREAMKHDLAVVDLRIALEQSAPGAVTEWISDHEMRLAREGRGGYSRTPDGAFTLVTVLGPMEFILEFERVAYRRTHYIRVLNRLRVWYSGHTILLAGVCPQRMETLRRWAEETRLWNTRPNGILFAPLQSLLRDGWKAELMDVRGQAPTWNRKRDSKI